MNPTTLQTKRIFIAAEFPQEVVQLLTETVKRLWPAFNHGIRWVPVEQYHLTLKFIGDYPLVKIPAVQMILQQQCHRIENIQLTLSGFGVFPNQRQPSVLWAGIHEADSLIQLQKNIENEAQKLGIEAEKRAFSPHLTLARIKPEFPSTQIPALLAPLPNGEKFFSKKTKITQITLFESQLTRQGSIYRVIESLKIG
jgi:RNA 2',3'-cyclic 3'-phosphodiesterase